MGRGRVPWGRVLGLGSEVVGRSWVGVGYLRIGHYRAWVGVG